MNLSETKETNQSVIHLTDQDFEETVVNGQKPILVDFWAPWCGPCRLMGPILDEIAKEMSNQITISKLNVDEHTEVAGALGIQSIPTLAIFKHGKVANVLVGARPKAELVEIIEETLNQEA